MEEVAASHESIQTQVEATSFKPAGYNYLKHTNPKSDRFIVKSFHHVEFWCSDATITARRFSFGLGLPIVAKSDLSTGNSIHASYLLHSNHLNLLFTAPYSPSLTATIASIPTFSHAACRAFTVSHGLNVRAVAIEVEDAQVAFSTSVFHGAKPSSHPILLDNGTVTIAEVYLFEDVVLRYISFNQLNPNPNFTFLPKFEQISKTSPVHNTDFGIRNLDHVFGNVPELAGVVNHIKTFTGFHEFVEFTADDVEGSETGMNSLAMASNNEKVLFGIAAPVYGTKRRSPIQTYLEHNEGTGVQHLALGSDNIFMTLREMRKRSGFGGFEFLPPPPPTYYRNLKNRAGDVLSDEQIKECEEMGILVDRDDQGTLLQIFTKPVGDRYIFN